MNNLPIILAMSDQLIVALVTLVLVGGVIVTSIVRYKVDEFVKFWAAIGTFLGVAAGSVGTYFFAAQNVETKDAQLKATKVALQASENQQTRIRDLATAFTTYVSSNPSTFPRKIEEFRIQLDKEKPANYWNTVAEDLFRDFGVTPTPIPSISVFAVPSPSASASASPSPSTEPTKP